MLVAVVVLVLVVVIVGRRTSTTTTSSNSNSGTSIVLILVEVVPALIVPVLLPLLSTGFTGKRKHPCIHVTTLSFFRTDTTFVYAHP